MFKKTIHTLAENPSIYNILRRILEFNYIGEKGVIKKEITSYGRILDLGCGTGELCREFVSEKYLGIDISEIYINYAKKKNPGYEFAAMDATKLSFPNASFDVVMISGVLHHCADDIARAILREVKRVLSPNGKVVVCEDVPTRGKMNFIGQAIQKLDEGGNILSIADYQRLFEQYFKIKKSYPMSSGFCDYQVFVF